MRNLFKVLIFFGIVFWAESALATIHLVLTNPSPGTLLELNGPTHLDCDAVVKNGAGAYLINVGLTNAGDTNILDGILAFQGGIFQLRNVVGGNYGNFSTSSFDSRGSTLFVGDGATLNASSISLDTLIVGGNARDKFSTVNVPEPSTIIIWLLLAVLGAVIGLTRRCSGI
jgi:hypothetical protein